MSQDISTNSSPRAIGASFRDPSGYIFLDDGVVHRYVAASYWPELSRLHDSGLYDSLVTKGWLIKHEFVPHMNSEHGKVLRPEQIPYISYPYEWSHAQLKAAAKLTLDIQHVALKHGMGLKDASAYNIQFIGSRPIFIDTLSFESIDINKPWRAYKQFCEHFLAPLALISNARPILAKLLIGCIDGIPLEDAAKLLPRKTLFQYSLFAHIHAHASSQAKHSDVRASQKVAGAKRFSEAMHSALVESLKSAITKISFPLNRSEWSHYYEDNNYTAIAADHKSKLVRSWIEKSIVPGMIVHDIGANTGQFSRISAEAGAYVVAHDIDYTAVERHYSNLREQEEGRILPLYLDMSNPAPSLGWASAERDSFFKRTQNCVVMALALVHHLAIANNTPLIRIAEVFASLAQRLIIEFVPKEDSQVERMLSSREDIFPNYTQTGFEEAFSSHFELLEKTPIKDSTRILYLFKKMG